VLKVVLTGAIEKNNSYEWYADVHFFEITYEKRQFRLFFITRII
jgi:hypothetical protein